LQGSATVDRLTEIILKFFNSIEEIGLFRFIGTGEIELLYRKLPQEVTQNHFSHDTAMIDGIVELLSLSPQINSAHLGAAFRNLFISTVYKREMGEEYFDEALRLTIRGLVMQMLD
jgi:adenylate cyclase